MKAFANVLLLSLASLSAHASVEGLWFCTSRLNNAITNVTTGKKLNPQKLIQDTQVTFFSNGIVESTSANLPVIGQGTWFQIGRKVVFKADPANAADNAEYGCSLAGSSCVVLSAFDRSVGLESRNGLKIKGKTKSRLTMLVRGLMLRSDSEGNFVCFR